MLRMLEIQWIEQNRKLPLGRAKCTVPAGGHKATHRAREQAGHCNLTICTSLKHNFSIIEANCAPCVLEFVTNSRPQTEIEIGCHAITLQFLKFGDPVLQEFLRTGAVMLPNLEPDQWNLETYRR